MEILAHRVGITIRHEWRADWGRTIQDRAADAEPHAARDLALGMIAPPGPTCAAFMACALTLALGQQADPLGYAPPAGPGEGPAPQEGCLCREHMVVPWRACYTRAARTRGRGEVCSSRPVGRQELCVGF